MAGPPPPPRDAPPTAGADGRGAPEVIRSLVDNTQLLVKKEIELAKLEIKEIVSARLKAVAFLAVAGILGLYLLAFVFVTLAKVLDVWLPEWAAWLIVTGFVLLLVVVLLLLARNKLKHPPQNAPERTKADVQETVEMAKRRVQQ